MSQYTGQKLVNKSGVVQVDKYGKELHIGQKVIYMRGNMTKGGRGDIGEGVIITYNRYVRIATHDALNRPHLVEHAIEHFNRDEYKKDKRPQWEKDREADLQLRFEDISSPYLIGVSDRFMDGWLDGSIRE